MSDRIRFVFILMLSLSALACSSGSGIDGSADASAPHGTTSDLEYVDTFTDYDERGTLDVISWAHFEGRPELKTYTEELLKEHRARTASLVAWRKEHFPAEPQRRIASVPCLAESLRVEKGDGAMYDVRLAKSLIRHRRCAIELSNQAIAESRDPEVLKISRGVVDAFTQQITKLEEWRRQWSAE